MGGYLLLLAGSSGSGREVAVVAASGFGVVTALLGRFVLKETVTVVQWTGDVLGILGVGLKGPPSNEVLSGIRAINDLNREVLALDMPSGLNSDTGVVEIDAIRASTTITFICCKPGLLTGEGPRYTGKLRFDSLGVGSSVFAGIQPVARRISGRNSKAVIQGIEAPAHKGEAGSLLIIGGNIGMGGSVRLAGEAAL